MTVRRLLLATALVAAAGFAAAAPASATECTPRGCSTSCRLEPRNAPKIIDCNWPVALSLVGRPIRTSTPSE